MQGDDVVMYGHASCYAYDKDIVVAPDEGPDGIISKPLDDVLLEWVKR
jgi:hypothetical protein